MNPEQDDHDQKIDLMSDLKSFLKSQKPKIEKSNEVTQVVAINQEEQKIAPEREEKQEFEICTQELDDLMDQIKTTASPENQSHSSLENSKSFSNTLVQSHQSRIDQNQHNWGLDLEINQNSAQSGFLSFQTARGRKLEISDKALKQAQKQFGLVDTDQERIQPYQVNQAVGNTAIVDKIENNLGPKLVSSDILEDSQENLSSQNFDSWKQGQCETAKDGLKVPENTGFMKISWNKGQAGDSKSFQTTAIAALDPEKLKAAKKLLGGETDNDEELELFKENTMPVEEPPKKPEGFSFGTFKTGGMKSFNIDPEKLKKAAALFGDDFGNLDSLDSGLVFGSAKPSSFSNPGIVVKKTFQPPLRDKSALAAYQNSNTISTPFNSSSNNPGGGLPQKKTFKAPTMMHSKANLLFKQNQAKKQAFDLDEDELNQLLEENAISKNLKKTKEPGLNLEKLSEVNARVWIKLVRKKQKVFINKPYNLIVRSPEVLKKFTNDFRLAKPGKKIKVSDLYPKVQPQACSTSQRKGMQNESGQRKLYPANYSFPRFLDIVEEFQFEAINSGGARFSPSDDESTKQMAFSNFFRQQLCSKLVYFSLLDFQSLKTTEFFKEAEEPEIAGKPCRNYFLQILSDIQKNVIKNLQTLKFSLPNSNWIEHHLMMISKKLHSVERGSLAYISDELFYRYMVEHVLMNQSALKYIFGEKTAESVGIVLRIDKLELREDRMNQENSQISLELSDGWYKVQIKLSYPKTNPRSFNFFKGYTPAEFDEMFSEQILARRILSKQISLGDKILIHNYSITHQNDNRNQNPLHKWALSISSNSLDKVKREVKLGFNFGMKRVPLKNVRQKSGQVQLTDFVVSHIVSIKKEKTGEIFHEEMLIQQDQEDYFDVRLRIIDSKDLATEVLSYEDLKEDEEDEDCSEDDQESVNSKKSLEKPKDPTHKFCFELVLFKVTWNMAKQICTGTRIIMSNLEVHREFEYGLLDSMTPSPKKAFILCKKHFCMNIKKNQDFAINNQFDNQEFKNLKKHYIQAKPNFVKMLKSREVTLNFMKSSLKSKSIKIHNRKERNLKVSLPLRYIGHIKNVAMFYLNTDVVVMLTLVKFGKPDTQSKMWSEYGDFMEKSPFVFFDLILDSMSYEKTLIEANHSGADKNQTMQDDTVKPEKECKSIRIYMLKYDLISSGMMCVSSYGNYGNFYLGSENYLKNYGGCQKAFSSNWLSRSLKLELNNTVNQSTQNYLEQNPELDEDLLVPTNHSKKPISKVFQSHSNMQPIKNTEQFKGSKSVAHSKDTVISKLSKDITRKNKKNKAPGQVVQSMNSNNTNYQTYSD